MSFEANTHALKRTLRSRSFWQWISLAAGLYLLIRLLRPPPPKPVRHTFEPLHVTPVSEESNDGIDWTRYAYVQYVTDKEYLCNSLMMFESLHRLGSKADRVLLYPQDWELYPKPKTWESMFLRQAQDDYKVHIVPVRPQHSESGEGTWAESFTKLLAFKQTQYDRVLSLDSDATILKPLDELFFLPDHPVAAPHAYWLPDVDTISSAILLIKPSMDEFKRVMKSMYSRSSSDEFYDMEVINDLYAGDAMILPNEHWVVSGEFRRKSHHGYLDEGETWDPQRVLNETKLVHFSDWPRPKPWFPASEEILLKTMPACDTMPGSAHKDCRNRDAWNWLYSDFQERRERVCGVAFTLY
ncbi:nucleotide-diphospho-sugar transferase [Aureobasidium pullulans]|nr:nucleotide-diphospho-sugar transferase [Aureobasidium pullulans]TIA06720.1 nucleotide-diphospho-sugar transferase [Aureobasidium pullulans]